MAFSVMTAKYAGNGVSEAAVVVAVCNGVGGGRRSRRAVRWAAEHLVPHAHRIVLVHVIPAISSIPSPSGELVPVDRVGRDLVEMYVQDQKLKAKQVFFPFRELCGTRNVDTVVLEGEYTAAALLKYVSESGTKNLVLGSSSNWFRRILKGPDVPTTVLNSSSSCCNIFVVSRYKLIMKFASRSVSTDPSPSNHIQTVSHKLFGRRSGSMHSQALSDETGTSTNYEASLYSSVYGEGKLNNSNRILEVPTHKKFSSLASIKDIPSAIFQSIKKGESSVEVSNLRDELRNTLAKYNQVCDDLVHAKTKVLLLSTECSEAKKKVKDALEREEMLKKIAAEERAKHLEAIKEVNETKQLLVEEAQRRYKAERVPVKVSFEKSETIDAYFLNSKWCRRYSKNEIELATDNFSEAKKIGEGSSGNVFKCILDHTTVAIKVLQQDVGYVKEQFLREVEILSQLHHPHMVLLLGVCLENGSLVYEYMENGSLDDQLFNSGGKKPLPWIIRFQILYEVACGLAFLHDHKPEPIVHRDLKPGNILLDRNYVSKIGDVGLAKLLPDVTPDALTEYRETVLAGTFYYMDPEYQRTGTIRPKSDLYAWGVVALQLLTGKRPNGLIVSVENAIKRGTFSDVLDRSITDWPHDEAERLAKLALQCSGLRCRDRPDLDSDVLPELEDILNKVSTYFKLRQHSIDAPKHYFCPLLQEIMDDPYVAADGYTYEYRAIKAWLEKHDASPMAKDKLANTSIIPNLSLRSAIQEWKLHVAFSASTK